MKKLCMIPFIISIAACSTPLEEGRTIGLSHSVPVSSTAFLKDIQTIIKERDYSYVSLAITKPQAQNPKPGFLARTIEITTGSGFVIDTQGHIVTAGHVGVSPGWPVIATGAHGKKYRGRVVAVQPIGDMALIQLDRPEFLKPVTPVKTPCLTPGAPVISLGKPGLRQDIARVGTLTKLRFGKPVRYFKYGYDEAMVLKLKTRRGESGGPVFDHSGAFLGMIVSTLSSSAGAHLNLAHAIPTPTLGKFICSKTKCRSDWQRLARKKLSSCPAALKVGNHTNS